MSIQTALKQAKATGGLIPFQGPLTWTGTPRAFLMTERFNVQIVSALIGSDPRRAERWDYLRADIAHYVEGGRVSWDFMRWLDPHKYEHWELRSVRPRPSLRVFGRFAEPDVFVATHAVERASLKAKWSLQWEIEKLVCEDEWKKIFGNLPPFASLAYEDYFTENAFRYSKVPP